MQSNKIIIRQKDVIRERELGIKVYNKLEIISLKIKIKSNIKEESIKNKYIYD